MLKSILEKSSSCFSNPTNDESLHGINNRSSIKLKCDVCIEESKVCKCNDVVLKEKDSEAKSSSNFLQAVINMVGMLIGLGQLSTPYALQKGGWSSSFLLLALGAICTYTSHLLGKCLDKNPKSKNYNDIGHNAYGNQGRIVAAAFIYMEIFMALVSYTISLHDNLNIVFLGTQFHDYLKWSYLSTAQILTVMAVLVALPSLWLRDLSTISFLSSGGIFMSMLIFGTVAWTAIFGELKANRGIQVLEIENIPMISGLYIFSFAGHIVFPNIHNDMKDPSKFTKVSIMSFSIVTILYTSLAFMGAKLFGSQVNPQITLSMPPHLIVAKIALWATVLTPMTKYALEFAPFAMHLENRLPHSMNPRTKMIIRGSTGSILLLLILVLALSVPYFEYVLSLTGSLVSAAICIVFPCVFYTKIYWDRISRPLLIVNVILIPLGLFFGVSGTISSLKLLIKNFGRPRPH